MTNYLELEADRLRQYPLILIVPGLDDGNPQRWLELWEHQYVDCRRVDLGTSDKPVRNSWVNRLNLAIHQAGRPVILVAHGLGCLTVAWWAEYERPHYCNPVVGALLVAPPDVDRPGTDPRLASFTSCPRAPMPFPSYLAASHDDPSCNARTAQLLASDWGSRFASVGAVGHLDGESGLGDWRFGKKLLAQLLYEHQLERGAERPSQQIRPPLLADADSARARLSHRRAERDKSPRTPDKVALANDVERLVVLDTRHA